MLNLPSPSELNRIVENARRKAMKVDLSEELICIKDAHLLASQTAGRAGHKTGCRQADRPGSGREASLKPQRAQWIAGYRDGWAGRKPPPDPSHAYQLGWTAGNTDRVIGKPRPAFAPLLESH